jgi:putative ABC transport system permease protein
VTEDAQATNPNAILTINFRLISPGLLETMGIPMLRGRSFTNEDRQGSVEAAIVSARMARRFWPGQDAIGKRLRVARPGTPWVTVVGVAGDVSDAHDPGGPIETWYRPYSQGAGTAAAEKIYLMVRTAGDPLTVMPAVEAAVWRVDKTLAPYRVTAMDAYYADSIARERLGAVFMLAIGGFGLVLAALGVYGVMAFSVAQRTTEIGIRIALGGRPGDILPMILRRALSQIAAGVALGVVTAMVLNRLLSSVLSGVGGLDRGIVAAASALIGAAAVLACLLPALKALRLDPAAALKVD